MYNNANNGIIKGHAYSILELVEIKDLDVKLLKLWNPWGKGEWNGSWSDESEELKALPENIKNDLNINNLDDGIFLMEISDFFKNFEFTIICMYLDF